MKQVIIAKVILLVLLSACASPTPAPTTSMVLENAWGRPSPQAALSAGFYLTIRNTSSSADKLLAARSPNCGTLELHESYQLPDGSMGMRMIMGSKIDIPANGKVELKSGGLHIMCIDKKSEMNVGTKIPLTLVFEKAGEVKITVEIREQ